MGEREWKNFCDCQEIFGIERLLKYWLGFSSQLTLPTRIRLRLCLAILSPLSKRLSYDDYPHTKDCDILRTDVNRPCSCGATKVRDYVFSRHKN